jgi:hypothetical protein
MFGKLKTYVEPQIIGRNQLVTIEGNLGTNG